MRVDVGKWMGQRTIGSKDKIDSRFARREVDYPYNANKIKDSHILPKKNQNHPKSKYYFVFRRGCWACPNFILKKEPWYFIPGFSGIIYIVILYLRGL